MELKTPVWFNSFSSENIDISIVIPCYKSKNQIIEQIKFWNLNDHGNLNIELIYVDDHCPENTATEVIKCWELRKNELSKPIGRCFLVLGKNSGFAKACNLGAKYARGKYIIFLNADVITTKNWIKPMYNYFFSNLNIGIIGNLQLQKDNTIESCGSEWSPKECSFFHTGKNILNGEKIRALNYENTPPEILQNREVKMINGCCFMISKSLFEEVNGFDENYKIGYFEDSDLCMKVISKGYKIWFCGESKIYHEGGHSGCGFHKSYEDNKNLFYKKWVQTKILNCHLENTNKIGINERNSVVYTAVTNNYDYLKPFTQKDMPFVAFVDNETNCNGWKIRECHKEFEDPNRNAKIHKILCHKYFPDKEFSLWIDASIKIKFHWSMKSFFENYLSDCDMAVFKHSERNCVYEEANKCCEYKLDDPEIIKKQMAKYKQLKVPEKQGLSECSVILRKHNEKVKLFNEIWWQEICQGSRRDQLSFDFAVKKSGVNCKYFPGWLPHNNIFFDREKHKPYIKSETVNSKKRSFFDCIIDLFKY